jgi:hypothetical protein
VLEKVSDPRLRVYVVWLPILGFDGKKAAAAATGLIPDSRAAHFWDREQGIGTVYVKVLGLPPEELAWDVYLLFPGGARWQAEPPLPAYWMHQVFYPSDNYLDGSKFRVEVEKLVALENRNSYEKRPATRRVPRQNLIHGPMLDRSLCPKNSNQA